MEQFAVAACVRLQLQNTEDELRSTTQTCTASNNERSLRSSHSHVVKVCKFSSQICFCIQLGGMNHNAEGQFVTFSRADEGLLKYYSLFEKVFFSLNSMYHTIINICTLMTADAIPKSSPSHPALSNFIALWMLNCFIYIAAELYFWLEKYTFNCGRFKQKL